MKQFPPVFALILMMVWPQGCATTQQAVVDVAPAAAAASSLAFPDAVPQGCAAHEALKSLAGNAAPEQAAEHHAGVLAVPPEHICWLDDAEGVCGPETCVQLTGLASLMRLHEGDYGIRKAVNGSPELKSALLAHLARALDVIAEEAGKPSVSELIDGLAFEQFRDAHANGLADLDSARVGDFLDGLADPLKLWALQNAVPMALERAEKALEQLAAPQMSNEERAAQARARAKAVRQREHDRLRAELQRRLLELEEAADRARRAADVVRSARAQAPDSAPVVVEEEAPEVVAEAPVEETYETRCRAGAATRTLGETPLKATAADIYCLVTEAKSNPKVVPKKEIKRLTGLYTSLQESVIGLALEELRWALADPTGARALREEIADVPLVSKSWKKRMTNKVSGVCTGHLTTLAKSDHEDIILADKWITECFTQDAGKRRTWHRKIASKLKHAIIWRDRLAAERAAKEAELQRASATPEPAPAPPAPSTPEPAPAPEPSTEPEAQD
ncbi:MAG: hypothetical protein ACPGU1_04515 [Myxococcota bacterium]